MIRLFLASNMRVRCVFALVFVFLASFSLSATAKSGEVKAERQQAAATMQLTTVQSKPMPSNTSLKNICDPERKASREKTLVLAFACTPVTSSPARLTAKSGEQRADVNCKYKENDQGGFDAVSCTCKADSDSNCTGFITWCAKQDDGDVGGNNQSATCD